MSESPGLKFCPDCQQDLPQSEFLRNVRMKDGLSFYCGPCSRVRSLASKRKRLGPPRTRSRQGPRDVPAGSKWCPECGEVFELSRFPRNRTQPNGYGAYCKTCHGHKSRAVHLRRKYGLTVEDFDRMFAEQGGLCAICREAPAEHVDHDHETDRVRGLLCFNCNGALGQFRDRRDLMLRAMAYLDTSGLPRSAAVSGFNTDAEFPSFHFGMHIGDFTSPRPADEPAPV